MKFRLSFEKKIISVKHLTETTVWLATLDSVGARVFFYNPTVRPRIDLISYGTRVFFLLHLHRLGGLTADVSFS